MSRPRVIDVMTAPSVRRSIATALVASVLAVACGGETVRFQAPASLLTSATPTPTDSAPSPSPSGTPDPSAACASCWPLSGRPVQTGAQVTRRPLVVKIDNVPIARPHHGLTEADIVIEQLVEGYVTRLVAVYHSQDAPTLGSIRSARLADRSLTAMFRGALVYSGTSDHAWSLISRDAASGRYVELSADHTQGYYRVGFRQAPYNLFTTAAAQREVLRARRLDTVPEVPRWSFLAAADHPAEVGGMTGAAPASEITIPYREDTSTVTYQYDEATRTYARWQNSAGKPAREVDGTGNTPIAAANVIVIQTDIWEVPEITDAAGAHAHDMRLEGTGAATVFRDGLRQEATWSRTADAAPFVLTSSRGETIKLSPGQTWIHIVPTDWKVSSR
ncbi:MAG TPA: DUF3048 domain-containing protein [Candidatus Limnocylindria bacterium]|nr:DUF3048 domain-containing protein [Candidatus Limnocylindria bacterium]